MRAGHTPPILIFVVIIMLAMALCLSGCAVPEALASLLPGQTADTAEGLLVYRISSDPADGRDYLRPEVIAAAESTPGPGELLARFAAPVRDGGGAVCALPAGVTLEDWTLENGVMTITLSDSFLDCAGMDRTVAALCAALTMCQLDEVDAVTVKAGGQTLFSGLVPADAYMGGEDADPYTRQLRLFFPDRDGRYLISEYHSLTLGEDTSPERYVIEELLRGPNSAELRAVMPEGTRLRSTVTGEDGVCAVDLSAEFYENMPATALGERLTLYAVVNSLTALPGVDAVRFLKEGAPVGVCVYRDLGEPLERFDGAVGPVALSQGELDADLYLAVPGMEAIAPLPYRVNGADFDSGAEAVLTALLNAAEPGYPVLFPGSGSVMDVTVRGGMCVVGLSESFFVSLPADARTTAVNSLAATLCALPEVNAVRFTVGGGPAEFDGVDWSGPWRDFTEIEVP